MSESCTPLFPTASRCPEDDTVLLPSFSSFQPATKESTLALQELLSSSDEDASPRRKRPKDPSPTTKQNKKRKQEVREEGFIVDRKGDKLNVEFEALYRLEVVPYRPQKLSFNYGQNTYSRISLERYFSPKHVLQQRSKKFKKLHFSRSESHTSGPLDELFLPLNLDEKDTFLMESLEEEISRKTRDFNTRLRQTPHDLELWRSFANYQDEVFQLTKRRVSIVGLAEKKISILSQALQHHPRNEELLTLLMKLMTQVVTPLEAQEKFEKLLLRLPASLLIWESYLNYLRSTFSEFSCDKIRGVYQGCMQGIQEDIRQNGCILIDASRNEECLILAFLLSLQFDLQSGFEEKAIAKIQSCLEWNFNSPTNKNTFSLDSLLAFFRRFWEDDSVSKIGESANPLNFNEFVDRQIHPPILNTSITTNPGPRVDPEGSTGWSGWFDVCQEPIPEENDDLEAEEEESEEVPETEQELLTELGLKLEELEDGTRITNVTLDRFFKTEEFRRRHEIVPKRHVECDINDLDRMVLFEELQPLFFEVEVISSKKKLLLGVFELLELDITDLISSNDSFFLRLEHELETTPVWLRRGLKEWVPSVERLTPWFLQDPIRGKFVLQLLEFFSIEFFPNDLRIRKLWLQTAFEIEKTTNPRASFTELGKSILKEYKNDLILWTAFGALLTQEEGIVKSRKVWKGVLQMMIQSQQDHDLCIPSIICELLHGIELDGNVLHILAFLATKDTQHLHHYLQQDGQWSMEIELQCEEYYLSQMRSITELTWEDYDLVICTGYFAGLCTSNKTSNFNPRWVYSNAKSWLKAQFSRFDDRRSRQVEALHETYCSWCESAGMPPRELKQEILASLELFPNSKKLLIQFSRIQIRSHTVSSLLMDLKSHVFHTPTMGSIALILHLEELKSMQDFNVSNLFERVLKMDECCASPLIWRLFLGASGRQGDLMKRSFLRAIRACPWSKSVWLEGLQLCSQGTMKTNEVNEFLETMKEKGIRLRTDIYEILLEDMV